MRHARSPSTGYTGLKVVVPRGAHMGPMATDPSVDNETATDQHHAAAGPTGQRNHSTDLLGCGALLPWDPSCKRWTTTELLRRASAEVVSMRNVDREWMVGHMLEYRDHYRRWTGHRNAYIAAAALGTIGTVVGPKGSSLHKLCAMACLSVLCMAVSVSAEEDGGLLVAVCRDGLQVAQCRLKRYVLNLGASDYHHGAPAFLSYGVYGGHAQAGG